MTMAQLLGLEPKPEPARPRSARAGLAFSFLFFSDGRADTTSAEKYAFTRDVTLFADREGFRAIYLPERHFFEHGSIFANASIMTAYLIAQTQRLRFRTAGISLPLHHPIEVVETWAINDILSGGRVDLGFGSGWSDRDFILAPHHYEQRVKICQERIPLVQRLWRGETVPFMGPKGVEIPITVYPRPLQKELQVWLLAVQNDETYIHAGKHGYNIFTMLSGLDLEAMGKKFALYREARAEAGHDPETGIVSLMLHTFLHEDRAVLEQAVKAPFKQYIRGFLDAHVNAGLGKSKGVDQIGEAERAKMLEYAFHRYAKTAALFGGFEEARQMVDHAAAVGVDEIACLVDFGVDYDRVRDSFPLLKKLVAAYC